VVADRMAPSAWDDACDNSAETYVCLRFVGDDYIFCGGCCWEWICCGTCSGKAEPCCEDGSYMYPQGLDVPNILENGEDDVKLLWKSFKEDAEARASARAAWTLRHNRFSEVVWWLVLVTLPGGSAIVKKGVSTRGFSLWPFFRVTFFNESK